MVRCQAQDAPGRDSFPGTMSPLWTWHEAGLEILPVVLRSRVRADNESPILGHALSGTLLPFSLFAKRAHAIHAVLSVVPAEGPAHVEGPRFD